MTILLDTTGIAERSAKTTWTGTFATGQGTVTSGGGALQGLPVTWEGRAPEPRGVASPEELAAAAHSASFAMTLARRLAEHGATPQRLEVTATVSLDDVADRRSVASSDLQVVGQVIDLDGSTFRAIVNEAATVCPISRLFAGAAFTVRAYLDGTWDE